MPNIKVYATRLKPGDDLKRYLSVFAEEQKLSAAWIVACAGSLSRYNIRFANRHEGTEASGYFEIISLTGLLSVNGSHLHISVSDSNGRTTGGHLLEGCIIYTTAEVIIQSTDQLLFKRENDGSTPWKELQIEKKNGKG